MELLGVAVKERQPPLAFYPYFTLIGVSRSIDYHIRQLLHFISFEVTQHMGIGARCLLDVGVSKKTLHDPNVYLLFCSSGGERVTQTMGVETADTGFIANSVEGTAHIDGVLRSAQLGAKDKVVILIGGPGLCFVLLLLFENIHQQLNCRLVSGMVLSLAGVLGVPNSKRQLSSGLSGSFTLLSVRSMCSWFS